MTTAQAQDYEARVVVTGVGKDGRSLVDYDGPARPRLVRPSSTIAELWQCDAVPAGAENTIRTTPTLEPPRGGVLVRMLAFPPESSWKGLVDLVETSAEFFGDNRSYTQDGFHQTSTIDVVTVVRGELHAVLESEERVLHPGDTLVQVGTNHAWRNLSSEVVLAVATMISADV